MVTETQQATHFGSEPHGGRLIDRFVHGAAAETLARRAGTLPVIELNARELSDVEMIAIGGFSPLEGFMQRDDYQSVVDSMRLAGGLPWTIPVTLSIDGGGDPTVSVGDDVALSYQGRRFAALHVADVFTRDREHEAAQVYRTTETKHPGVAALMAESDTLIGGPISVFAPLPEQPFAEYRLPPAETRRRFAERGWRTIVGFQTRNPVHRAHEYMQKCAMEIVDGLLLHPLVGETKSDDVPAAIRMRSYEVLLENYYPADRAMLAVNPSSMRYGGPREAVFHALIRKNFGCTHFIVGRDHAGVGGYYGPYDAQHIFSEFEPGEIGIQPLFFENAFYCKRCGNNATTKTCPHGPEDRVILSGTQVREMLRRGDSPPPEFSRPEVARVLVEGLRERA